MTNKTYTAYCDGGARNNPGPAGAGFVILQEGEEVLAAGAYLGETTNNVAEYCGLIWVLENAEAIGAKSLEVYADSSLMVNQLNGSFRVKDAKMKRLYEVAKELVEIGRAHV
jgi:ribonuclease HI